MQAGAAGKQCTSPEETEADSGGLPEATYREIEARRLDVCLPAALPNLEKKWEQALGYLNEIGLECHRRRVPLAVVLIPDEFSGQPGHPNAGVER